MSDAGSPSPSPGGAPAPAGPSGPPPDEFAGIPPGRSRHPVLAAAALTLAGFLSFQLRHDIAYALSSSEPRSLGEARMLLARAALPVNRYVTLQGRPDWESALVIDVQGSWEFAQLFRLLSADGGIFVRRASDPLPVALAESDRFSGRLMRFRDLSYQASIRRHFADRVTATHILSPRAVVAALASGGAPEGLTDLVGERVRIDPQDELAVDSARPGDVRLELPRERFGKPAEAQAAIEAQGGEVVEPVALAKDRHILVVRFPAERRDRALSALGELDRRVRILPARTTVRARWRDLTVQGEDLIVNTKGGKPRLIPLAEVEAIRLLSPVVIPADALILLEGERPRGQLKTLVILAFLVAFAGVNLLALRRAF